MYLAGVALICVGNLAFYWRPVLSLEDLSSLIGSSGSSGDTEVSSDTGSCDAVQLDMTPASALVPGSPPYHLQVRGQTKSYWLLLPSENIFISANYKSEQLSGGDRLRIKGITILPIMISSYFI